MPLLLFPFRYRDEVTRKWVRARYKAEIEVITERFEEWEIIGLPEERIPNPVGFNPYRQPIFQTELMCLKERVPQTPPAIDH